MSDAANYAFVAQRLELESLIDYIIINVHTVCKDWLNWNTAWWRGRKPTGLMKRWRYTLWDMDATFGHYINYTNIPDISPQADPCDIEQYSDLSDPEGHIDILLALFQNDHFRDLYINRYADLNNSWLSCDSMLGLLDQMVDRISPEMPRHIQRWGGNMEAWQANVQAMRDFILARCDFIDGGLISCYDLQGPWSLTVHVWPEGSPNAVRINTIVPSHWPYTGDYFGGVLLHCTALPAAGWQFSHWETSNITLSPDAQSDSISLSMNGGAATLTAVFEPAIPCAPPDMLHVIPFASGAQVQWHGWSSAISYELRWRPYDTADWQVVSVLDDSLALYGLEPCTDYELGVRAICGFDLSSYAYTTFTTECTTAQTEPIVLSDCSIWPNPFAHKANVRFSLQRSTPLHMELWSPSGKRVWQWRAAFMGIGTHEVTLQLDKSVPEGLYLLVVRTNHDLWTQKCIVIKW